MSVVVCFIEFGIEFFVVVVLVVVYVFVVVYVGFVYMLGQLFFVDGVFLVVGKVGVEVFVEDVKFYVCICVFNVFVVVVDVVGGVDCIVGVFWVGGFVVLVEGFMGQLGVVNGVSDVLGEIFGDVGCYVCVVVGVVEFLFGSLVEVEVIFFFV